MKVEEGGSVDGAAQASGGVDLAAFLALSSGEKAAQVAKLARDPRFASAVPQLRAAFGLPQPGQKTALSFDTVSTILWSIDNANDLLNQRTAIDVTKWLQSLSWSMRALAHAEGVALPDSLPDSGVAHTQQRLLQFAERLESLSPEVKASAADHIAMIRQTAGRMGSAIATMKGASEGKVRPGDALDALISIGLSTSKDGSQEGDARHWRAKSVTIDRIADSVSLGLRALGTSLGGNDLKNLSWSADQIVRREPAGTRADAANWQHLVSQKVDVIHAECQTLRRFAYKFNTR